MFFEHWKPVFAPETEVGSAEVDVGAPPEVEVDTPSEPAQPDGPGSGRSALRKSLEEGFERDRKTQEGEPEKRGPRQVRKGGDRVGGRLAEMPESGTPEEAAAPVEEENILPESNPPEGWSPEAKAEWANASDAIRAAVLKRESDVTRGVRSLQAKYAEIDKALEPHLQKIAAYNKSPGDAINQLFSWFDSLAQNPKVAFPALAQSFGYDINQFARPQTNLTPQPQAQTPPGQPGQTPEGGAPQAPPGFNQKLFEQRYAQFVRQELSKRDQAYDQRLQGVMAQIQQQNQAKTEETLAVWAKDKPFYDEVREDMAYLIGSGAVPLKEGRVDLEGAYNRAIWGNEVVRNQMLQQQAAANRAAAAEKKKAEAKAQAEQAAKAAKAATSVPLSAPGVPSLPKAGGSKKGKTVGETLREAIATHRDA